MQTQEAAGFNRTIFNKLMAQVYKGKRKSFYETKSTSAWRENIQDIVTDIKTKV